MKVNVIYQQPPEKIKKTPLKTKTYKDAGSQEIGLVDYLPGPDLEFEKNLPHTVLAEHETAAKILTKGQKVLILAAGVTLTAALIVNWHAVVFSLLAAFTIIYFFDLVFSMVLVFQSFKAGQEITISESEKNTAPIGGWPLYTVFCPLYHEWQVAPQFVRAMQALDYPKDKLEIFLLLEEDDEETVNKIGELQLPENIKAIVVPHSLPKTKPKALNYGLRFARGEFTVVYDAEDVPDSDQLKKAVTAFAKSSDNTICVQAKLNFYNPRQNLLTKIFTAEYSLWFDLILPGLQALFAPIPLGGTSNHFRTSAIKQIGGWDGYNVTEDCDLGIRISKKGYQTRIMDSTTWEEANSQFGNWYRQRSRWVKGYMQTYLVHMRQWKEFISSGRRRNLFFFQLTVGGKVISMFVNPFMWLFTIAYFSFRPQVGPIIESFFPSPLLYMGVFSFVFGNFFYLYNYMIGLAKREFDGLIKYVFFVPLYWLGMSLAAWKALYELVIKPHYWAKTKHGLHLQKQSKPQKIQEEKQKLNMWPGLKNAWQAVKTNLFAFSGSFLVGAVIASDFTNFLFTVMLGRFLSLEEFGVIVLFNNFMLYLAIITSALAATVNHRVAFLTAKGTALGGSVFRVATKKKALAAALGFTLLWLLSSTLLAAFFNVPNVYLAWLFSPVAVFGFMAATDRGFLLGTSSFIKAGTVLLAESVVKFLVSGILILLGLQMWVAASLPVSLGFAFLLTWYLARVAEKQSGKENTLAVNKQDAKRFPRRFFTAAVLTGLSSTAFLSLDVILAKHFLGVSEAGQYALLSLIGKMVFYFGSLLSVFIITFTSQDEGANRNPNHRFYKILKWTLLLVGLAWVPLGLLGKFTAPLIFGAKAANLGPLLPLYTAGAALYAIANAFVVYHLARKHLLFSFVSLFSVALLAIGIFKYHDSIASLAHVLFAVSLVNLILMGLLHLLQRNGRFIVRNLVDLVDAFFPLAQPRAALGGKRILVFNWRDTKHVFAGGAEVYIHELAKRWVKEGHHVTVFCGNDGQTSRQETIDGVRIIRRGGFYMVYVWAFVYYLLQFRGRFDLIIDCENGIPFFTPLYAKEKVVCLLHHVHQQVFRKYLIAPLAFFASILENRVMPWAYRQAKFITISDSSKDDLLDLGLGLNGVKIIHPGINLDVLRPGQKEKFPLVLYLGRLKAYKSVDVLIKAFKNIVAKIPQARLVIAGSGEEERNLKNLAAELALSQVIFAGKVSEEEKLSLLQKAWVLVNPSMIEGWGITTIEANACSVPVVAADVPGLRDSVRNPHTGYLVPHGDVEGFSRRITELLMDHKLRGKMGRYAVLWAKKFDWNNISEQGLKVIYE